jgi:LysM repeat protein
MSTGKVSIFITVLAFHASILAVVFLTTRPEIVTILPDTPKAPNVKKGTPPKHGKRIPEKKKYLIHTVGNSEYLGKIAAKYKVTTQAIIQLNNIQNPNRISKGRNLKIPLN